MFFDLEEELKKLPASPGVYLMHNHRAAAIKQPRSSRWFPILRGLNIS